MIDKTKNVKSYNLTRKSYAILIVTTLVRKTENSSTDVRLDQARVGNSLKPWFFFARDEPNYQNRELKFGIKFTVYTAGATYVITLVHKSQ